MTGYLQVATDQLRPYDLAISVISELLQRTSSDRVVDLASGAGGPWHRLLPILKRDCPSLHVTLTDIRPNAHVHPRLSSTADLQYQPESVSAEEVTVDLGGVRTMFTALHHFDRVQVRSILSSAQRDRVGFAAFEATQRSVRGVLITLLIPLLVLALMPRTRPRRAVPLLLTYLPPILPAVIWWDGFASTLRTYTPEELRALVAEIAEPGYSWRVEEVFPPRAPIPVLQVIGGPERAHAT